MMRFKFFCKLFIILFFTGSNFVFSAATENDKVATGSAVADPVVAAPVATEPTVVSVTEPAKAAEPAKVTAAPAVADPVAVPVVTEPTVAPVLEPEKASAPAKVLPVAPVQAVTAPAVAVPAVAVKVIAKPEVQAATKFTEQTAAQLPVASVPVKGVKSEAKKETVAENKEELKLGNAEIEGLDTVSVREPEGNWLLKRIWWEKAKKKYEKIKDLVAKTIESRTPFFEKRNELEKKVLNPFYSEIGLKGGQLIEIVNALLEKIKQDRAENITLNEKEREFLELVKEEESNLKQLEADIKGIKSLDDAIDQDLEKLAGQINRSRRYEDNAWQLFSAISKELSHKKARELYYKMDALWQNVKSIDEYIKNAFSNHFDLIIENANSQVTRIKGAFDKFKDKGLDLKKKYKELFVKKDDKELEQEKIKAEAAEAAAKAEEEQKALEQEVGTFGLIWNGITWPFRTFWDFITSFWS